MLPVREYLGITWDLSRRCPPMDCYCIYTFVLAPQAILDHIGITTKSIFCRSMMMFAKVRRSNGYGGFVLLFVLPIFMINSNSF